jgi:DNA-binding transcriptional LysR family regulator
MSITLHQMQAFAEVARHASFTRAAATLHLTQSATSSLIKDLEQKLGLQLFDRTTRSVVLTRAGEEFRIRTERILADVANAVADAKDLLDKRRGQVSIAASPLASATFLPGAIAAFAEVHPYVTVVLHDMLTDGIVEQVRNGTAELGIGTFVKSVSEVELVTLFEDRLGVVLAANGPLAGRRKLTWRDVASQPRISLSQSSAFRPLIDSVFASLGLPLTRPRLEVGYMGTAVALVEAGLGISILPERAASLARTDAACWRPLANPAVTQPSTLVTRAGRSLSPGARAFVDFLVAYLRSTRRTGSGTLGTVGRPALRSS